MNDLERYLKEEGLVVSTHKSPLSNITTIVIDRNIMHSTRRRLRFQAIRFYNGYFAGSRQPVADKLQATAQKLQEVEILPSLIFVK